MKIQLTIITLLFGLSLSAQTFERTFTYPGDEKAPAVLEELNNHYFFTIGVQGPNGYKSVLYKIGQNGLVSDSLSLNEFYYYMVEYNNFLYLFKNEEFTDSLKIVQINPATFNVVQQEQHDLKNDLVIYNSRFITNCNCFALVGASRDTKGYSKGAAIIQLDTNLSLMKEAYYQFLSGPDSSLGETFPKFYDVLPSPDGNGMWLMAEEPIDVLFRQPKAAVIAVDSNLVRDSVNFKILQSFDHPSPLFTGLYWGIFPRPYSGVQLTDSTFLFAGRAYLDKGTLQNTRIEDDMAYAITDENLNHDLRWEFWGGQSQSNQPTDSTELSAFENGVSKYKNHVYIGYTSDFDAFFHGKTNLYTLRKIDLQGNEIWTKHYSTPLSYLVYSVLATSDEGALISGTIGDPNVPERNVWMLKVDSAGNRLITSDEQKNRKIPTENYQIYPNPAQDEINLLKVNQFKPYEFELYDAFGRLIKSVFWREDFQQMDVYALSSGVYVYRIVDKEGNVGSGKLVIK